MTSQPDALLTAQDVADLLHVSIRTVYGWASSGTGPPCTRVGHLVRWQPAHVQAWLDANTAAQVVA